MATVTPFLWLQSDLQPAIEFYTSVFPDAAVESSVGYPQPGSGVGSATLRLGGQRLMLLAGGPNYRLTPAFSLFISCADQDEVNHYWDALLDGGRPSRCGWLEDRFGLSWQVVPGELGAMLADPDPARAGRVAAAMMAMVKLDVGELRRAWQG